MADSWEEAQCLDLKTIHTEICYIFIQGRNWPGNGHKTHILNKKREIYGSFANLSHIFLHPPGRNILITNIPPNMYTQWAENCFLLATAPAKDVIGIELLYLTVGKWIANSFWAWRGIFSPLKKGSFYMCLWSVRALTNYFPRNFFSPNATRKKRFALKEKLLCLKKLQRYKGFSSISPSSRLLQEIEAGSLKIFPSHLKAEGSRRMERKHCQVSQPHCSCCGGALLNSSTDSTKRSWPSLTLLKRHFGTSMSNWSRGQLRVMSPRSYWFVPNSSTRHFGKVEIPGNISPHVLPGAGVILKLRKHSIFINRVQGVWGS